MPLTPEIADQLLATCRQNASEAAEALTRALGTAIEIPADRISTGTFADHESSWQGAGLAIVLKVDEHAVLLLIPEVSSAKNGSVLPAWYAKPDPTGVSKLTTLAQELGMILLPEEFMPLDFTAKHVVHVASAAQQGGIQPSTNLIRLELRDGDRTTEMVLLWPCLNADQVFAGPKPAKAPEPAARSGDEAKHGRAETEEEFEVRLEKLPGYIRSLLHIRVAVSVTLATTKQPVSRIMNLGPGSIIQFEKHCEQPLTLCIGNQRVAEGEACKVGEKFGIKITAMILPGEQFLPLRGNSAYRRRAS